MKNGFQRRKLDLYYRQRCGTSGFREKQRNDIPFMTELVDSSSILFFTPPFLFFIVRNIRTRTRVPRTVVAFRGLEKN